MKYNFAMKEDFEVDEKKQAAADVLFSYSKFALACIGNQTRPSDMRLHLMKEISGMPTSLKRRESSRAATSPDPVGGESSSTGFTFIEVKSVRASTGKVTCCHFSSDGYMLATAGHDKKAVLWQIDNNMKPETTLEEHTALITDIRFSPRLPRFATSSFDKTVRVWDADNKDYSLRTFMGHSSIVTSLDFHPIKDDLICSCDNDNEIRYWSINNGSSTRVYWGGSTQMRSEPQIRFQPRVGKYLAASSANLVNVLDVETQVIRHSLQGHANPITSVCWDPSGDFLASVSEDMVKVWTLGKGSEGECVHQLRCDGNKFQSCVFHPTYSFLLVIGCYQSIELWNLSNRRKMTLSAHEGIIASLAGSATTGLVASASHDNLVKLWK